MEKPAIALCIEGTYPWYRGGVSEWVYRYIKAFPDYQFHIIQVATDEYLHAELNEALYPVPQQIVSFKRVGPPRGMIHNLKEISGWFDEIPDGVEAICRASDMIHVANTGFAGWLGLKMAKKAGRPLILTEHALYWKEVEMGAVALECGYKVPENSTDKQAMVGLFKTIAEAIYLGADEIISVSKCNIPFQKDLGAGRVHYIPNGVDADWLQHQKERNEIPVIGWIGRCAEMKNPLKFFSVIEAFRERNDISPNFIMMTCDANEPELQQKVIQKAKQYSELNLIINRPAEEYLSDMDALCITSHNESQPLVLFEALSKKVLPMGWQAGDVTEEFGLIIPSTQTADELVKCFLEIWNDPAKWEYELNQRFKKIEQNHTWQTIFEQYSLLFSSYTKEQAVI